MTDEDFKGRIAALEARVEELEFYLAEIQGKTVRPPWGTHFTRMEMAVLNALALASPRIMSKGAILTAVHPTLDQPQEKIVDVYVCRIRPLIAQLGLSITTHWGQGYSMPRADAEKWRTWTQARAEGRPRPDDYPDVEGVSFQSLKRNAA